jgi:hypothetical protein
MIVLRKAMRKMKCANWPDRIVAELGCMRIRSL